MQPTPDAERPNYAGYHRTMFFIWATLSCFTAAGHTWILWLVSFLMAFRHARKGFA
jgi:hypothetical protein